MRETQTEKGHQNDGRVTFTEAFYLRLPHWVCDQPHPPQEAVIPLQRCWWPKLPLCEVSAVSIKGGRREAVSRLQQRSVPWTDEFEEGEWSSAKEKCLQILGRLLSFFCKILCSRLKRMFKQALISKVNLVQWTELRFISSSTCDSIFLFYFAVLLSIVLLSFSVKLLNMQMIHKKLLLKWE